MAKQNTSSKVEDACTCRADMGILGLVFLALGIYFLVMGFVKQIGNPTIFLNWWSMIFYLIGISFYGFGHLCKHNAYHVCSLHGLRR